VEIVCRFRHFPGPRADADRQAATGALRVHHVVRTLAKHEAAIPPATTGRHFDGAFLNTGVRLCNAEGDAAPGRLRREFCLLRNNRLDTPEKHRRGLPIVLAGWSRLEAAA